MSFGTEIEICTCTEITVPNVYPVDMFEHIWVVDRLERLGISRYFKSEIKECMDYIHRYFFFNFNCFKKRNFNYESIQRKSQTGQEVIVDYDYYRNRHREN